MFAFNASNSLHEPSSFTNFAVTDPASTLTLSERISVVRYIYILSQYDGTPEVPPVVGSDDHFDRLLTSAELTGRFQDPIYRFEERIASDHRLSTERAKSPAVNATPASRRLHQSTAGTACGACHAEPQGLFRRTLQCRICAYTTTTTTTLNL